MYIYTYIYIYIYRDIDIDIDIDIDPFLLVSSRRESRSEINTIIISAGIAKRKSILPRFISIRGYIRQASFPRCVRSLYLAGPCSQGVLDLPRW